MRDLTQGAIWRHLVSISMFIGLGLIVQTLYLLIDLYFVSRLGKQAIAGVAAAGTSTFITMSLSQLVGVGTLSLVSHAVGRKDQADAQNIFEQALSLGIVMAICYLALGYAGGKWAVGMVSADPETARFAQIYLYAFLPALAGMFPGAAMGSALRASGIVAAPMMIQSATVFLNVLTAPVLIAGWGTGHPLGVLGAGLASSISSLLGCGMLAVMFNRLQTYMRLRVTSLVPLMPTWKRIIKVGLPATGEFALIFIVTTVVYWCIRRFGPQAQAGFGIAYRVMQSIFLPAMAIAFATGPVAGQNFGAKHAERVRDTFSHAAIIGVIIMFGLTLLCQYSPAVLIVPFTKDPAVASVAVQYLRIASWNFVAIGITFTCSGMFQALGDTRPALLSSGTRLVTHVAPSIWLAGQAWAELRYFWYLGVVSIVLQAFASLWLLRYQLRSKLRIFAPS